MRQITIEFLAVLLLGVIMTACKSVGDGKPTLPPVLPAGIAGLSEIEINNARKLYVAKCAKCHRFYDPADYSLAVWNSWMDKMSRKSKLEPGQEELLSRYLGAFRRRESSGHRAQAFARRMRVRRPDDFSEQEQRWVGELVFLQDRIKRNIFPMMSDAISSYRLPSTSNSGRLNVPDLAVIPVKVSLPAARRPTTETASATN